MSLIATITAIAGGESTPAPGPENILFQDNFTDLSNWVDNTNSNQNVSFANNEAIIEIVGNSATTLFGLWLDTVYQFDTYLSVVFKLRWPFTAISDGACRIGIYEEGTEAFEKGACFTSAVNNANGIASETRGGTTTEAQIFTGYYGDFCKMVYDKVSKNIQYYYYDEINLNWVLVDTGTNDLGENLQVVFYVNGAGPPTERVIFYMSEFYLVNGIFETKYPT